MIWTRKRGARRKEIHRKVDASRSRAGSAGGAGAVTGRSAHHAAPLSLWVVVLFFGCAAGIMMMREDVVPYRPGQYTAVDVVSRVTFTYNDKARLQERQQLARAMEPKVYTPVGDAGEPWKSLEQQLLKLPNQVANLKEDDLPAPLNGVLNSGALNKLQEFAAPARFPSYASSVQSYVEDIRKRDPIILREDQRRNDLTPGRAVT